MIESARFTNVNGAVIDFNTDTIPCNVMTTEVDWRFTEKNRSQRHGIYPGDSYLGKRVIHFEGTILADNSAQYWDRRIDFMNAVMTRPQFGKKVSGTLRMLLTGFPENVYADCTLDGWPEMPIEGLSPSLGRFQINFKSFDPRLYGELQSTDIAYNPAWENFGGRTYNKTYNKSWSTSANAPSSAIISNIGNIEVYPTLIFYGPATNPAAVMVRSDGLIQIFSLSGVTLSSVSDFVTVDMENHTVVRSDGSNLFDAAVGSDWFSLEPYPITNTINLTASSIAAPAHLSILFRNGYII